MESDELYIIEKVGKHNPFAVPEGFIDSLNDNILRNVVQDEQPKSAWIRLRKYVAVAACLLAIVSASVVALYSSSYDNSQSSAMLIVDKGGDNTSIVGEDFADYTMLDNDDIYSLMASN